jgi:hypothetical protein
LVVLQVALSLVLLSAAGLFVHRLSSLENLDLGFQRDHVLLIGVPLLAGRDFTSQDRGRPPVAIVNQTLSRYYFGDGSPLHQREPGCRRPRGARRRGRSAAHRACNARHYTHRPAGCDACRFDPHGAQRRIRTCP